MSRKTKSKTKTSNVDEYEVSDIKDDLEDIFQDINTDMHNHFEKVEEIESRIEEIENPEAVEAMREFVEGFKNILYADMEYGDIKDALENQIEEIQEESEEDDNE